MCLVQVLLVVASGAVLGAPGQAPVEVLCDFEAGAEGWWGNVFNGAGTCKPQTTDAAKFGAQALECHVNGVEGGSNDRVPVVSAGRPLAQPGLGRRVGVGPRRWFPRVGAVHHRDGV